MMRYASHAAGLTLVLALPVAAVAQDQEQPKRTVIAPYVEASQTLSADLNGGDVLTYTTLAAGVDAATSTRNAQAQVSARYEHRFGEDKYSGSSDLVSGLAQGTVKLGQGVSFSAGGLATRTREDIRGAAPALLTGNDANVTQLYSVYAGPTLATHAGPLAIGAAYQIGYTKVDAPGSTGVAPGVPRLDYYDHSISQNATATVGFAPGTLLPVGLTASAGYSRDDASQLNQRYEDAYGRVDALLPVSATIALAAGVGYEKVVVSQKAALLNPDGTPVLTASGRFVADDSQPRQVDYRTDGVFYDAGVVWHPNHRTSVSAYVGRRYGSMSYTGTASYQAPHGVAIGVQVYDQVETFGQQLRQGIAALPTSFIAARDAYSQQYNGCTFSTSGTTPGGCLNQVFQSISNSSYRARGVDAVMSVERGLATYGAGAGYSNRKFFAANVPSGVSIDGIEDQSYYAQLFLTRRLSRVSGVNGNLFFNYYKPAQRTGGIDGEVYSYGATASYYHNFGHLSTVATVGLYDLKQGDIRSQLSAEALLAIRYTF